MGNSGGRFISYYKMGGRGEGNEAPQHRLANRVQGNSHKETATVNL